MKFKKILEILFTIFLIILIFFVFNFYSVNNFNDFYLSKSHLNISKFTRDKEEKYSNNPSYKITSEDYNDAMFSQTVKVKKDTSYKVTCMVKTKDVVSKNNLTGSGAQISIEESTEKSPSISGTSDWQKIEMIFNSRGREEVNIGFRLGGYVDECKGEAWFSDFKLEEGTKEKNADWRFACFIFDNVNATVNGQKIDYTLSQQDIIDINNTIKRFESSITTMSNGLMTSAKCDTYRIDTPITELTYDETYGYFVDSSSVEPQIKEYMNGNNYDYVFIIFKLDDQQVKDWVGLGAMEYYGLGYSNIRLLNKDNNYLYRYNARVNTFPEEVFVHEFLHTYERILQEYGYKIPELHDYSKYGYTNKSLEGLKQWYADYMTCNIKTNKGNIGLDPIVYTIKPTKSTDFQNSTVIENTFYEPQNVFEKIVQIFKKAGKNLSNIFKD